MTAALRRGHRSPRARPARQRAAGQRDDRADRRPHPGADRQRQRLCRRRGRVLPRALRPRLRVAQPPRRRRHGPGRGRRGRRSQGGSARFRPLEGAEGGRGHRLGRAVGPRAPGLAHRVLGDGRGAARRRLRDPRRRQRPDLPAPRERGRPDARGSRRRARADLDAQRDAPVRRARRWPRASATSSRWPTPSSAWGRDALVLFFCSSHYRQPVQYSDGHAARRAGRRAALPRGRAAAARGRRRPKDMAALRDRFFAALAR